MGAKSEKRDLIVSISPLVLDQRHRSVERTFGIFAAATFLLMVLPTGMLAVFEFFGDDHPDIVRIHALSLYRIVLKFCAMNPTLNVVAYALKHKQIYNGLRQVFVKKHPSTRLLVTHSQHKAVSHPPLEKSATIKSVATSRHNGTISFKDLVLKFRIVRFPESLSPICESGNLTLLVIVQSVPSSVNIRNIIRATWANKNKVQAIKDGSSRVLFLIGNGDTETSLLRKEAEDNDDVLSVDVEDSYRNLIYKTALTLHTSHSLCPSSFVLKVDEDVVFNIDRFMQGVGTTFRPEYSAIYCKVWHASEPSRDHKNDWFVSEHQYGNRRFPDYCAGPSYVLTYHAADSLMRSLSEFNLITVEDVFVTGIVAEKANVTRIGMDDQFKSDYAVITYTKSMCPGSLLSIHNLKNEAQIRSTWEYLSRNC
ncbi:hypothetical protein PFISCL1PPCAC_25207, partial [Pristionchus fissidentatus]